MNMKILEKCTLFRGLNKEQLKNALDFFESERSLYTRGSSLNKVSTPLTRFGLVLSGTVRVFRDDVNGNHMILTNVEAGGTFGESLCYLGREVDIYIRAVTDAEILWLKTVNLYNHTRIREPDGMALHSRFTAMLAERAMSMNNRIQTLSQPTIRGKLFALFAQYAPRGSDDAFELPFDRSSMAFYLAANRSALSRELCRMRDEGLIDFCGNKFRILKQEQLHGDDFFEV